MKKKHALSFTREENYSEWYLEVIKKADLAEHSCVRGCMNIKPWGYAIWENIKNVLDNIIKRTGHKNLYFPLFIPLSFLEKEAKHVEGFAKECAVVTHHRLEKNKEGKLVPTKELEEPYIIRPTSEMIMGEAFSRWISSYRDLPLLVNQWANIVRWEMRPRMFLRTTEFLWQEGHTVHQTKEEAHKKAKEMLDEYYDFLYRYLAISSIKGEKTEKEKFPGADITYTLESMMQDKKALQAVTSHFLGQNFAKASNIKFQNKKGKEDYVWTTSWGASTRLIGALIMTHSDDDGLVLPPRIAPIHIVIQPILHKEKEKVISFSKKLQEELKAIIYDGKNLEIFLDERDIRGGEKKWEWIKKGVPIRVEIGPKEIETNSVGFFRRDNIKELKVIKRKEFVETAAGILEDIQASLLKKAISFREKNIFEIDTEKEFNSFFSEKEGFVLAPFYPDKKIEEKIQEKLNVTVRAIPIDAPKEKRKCIFTNKETLKKAIFAKAY